MSHGVFLVLDGTEGAGKSTQARRLEQRLASLDRQALLVRDPGTTRIGEQIRAILLDPAHAEMSMRCEMLLYMSARAQMMDQIIGPALDSGRVVICDRFVSSTLAYQLGGDGLTAEEIRSVAQIAIRGRWPDLTILLDLAAEKSLARVQRAKDRIEQRPLSYHQQVRANYLAQAQDDPARYRVIDADRPPQEVADDVLARGGTSGKEHAVTEFEKPDQPDPAAPQPTGSAYSKGDVLHPEWGERPPWFGYIGVGIAMAAMLIGLAGMVLFVLYIWRSMSS